MRPSIANSIVCLYSRTRTCVCAFRTCIRSCIVYTSIYRCYAFNATLNKFAALVLPAPPVALCMHALLPLPSSRRFRALPRRFPLRRLPSPHPTRSRHLINVQTMVATLSARAGVSSRKCCNGEQDIYSTR